MKNYTGSDLGQDFKDLYAKDKKSIGKQLQAMGCTKFEMSRQFNYYYGFLLRQVGKLITLACRIGDIFHINLYCIAPPAVTRTGRGVVIAM